MKVLTIEQMNQLKELGVDVKPKCKCLMYTSDSSDDYYLKYGESTCEDDIKAFTLQDVIELLPKSITDYTGSVFSFCIEYRCLFNRYTLWYISCDYDPIVEFCKDDLLQAAYEMLLWVIENGYLTAK